MKFDYTRIYGIWHNDTPEHRKEMIVYLSRLLSAHLPKSRDSRILDVGCGTGFALLMLKEMGYKNVAGIDSDEGQVAGGVKLSLDVTQTDDTIGYLRERAGRYDVILCLDVIEHVPVAIQLEFVNALLGALRPDGRLIATVPNANSSLASVWRYNCWTHTTSFTEHSFDFILYNGGFKDIQIVPGEPVRKPPPLLLFPIPAALSYAAWRFFRLMRRIELMAELGTQQGLKKPLSLNLLGIATKRS